MEKTSPQRKSHSTLPNTRVGGPGLPSHPEARHRPPGALRSLQRKETRMLTART